MSTNVPAGSSGGMNSAWRVNSIYGRSQDQLHIHIDCIKPAVGAALHAHASAIGLNGRHFQFRWRANRISLSGLTDPTLPGSIRFVC